MNDLFNVVDEVFSPLLVGQKQAAYPKINVYNESQTVAYADGCINTLYTIVEATVPGLTREDINVEWKNNTLIIYYQPVVTKTNENRTYLYREIHQSGWWRSLDLSDKTYDVNNIEACVDNGLLKIYVPFFTPKTKTDEVKKIEVK